MSTYTVVADHNVDLAVEAPDISLVAHNLANAMVDVSPRGARKQVNFALVIRESEWFQVAYVSVLNSARRVTMRAVVIANQPAVARRVTNIMGGGQIFCRTCGHGLFYYRTRSLDHEYHQCARCTAEMQTLTETGASA